MSESPRVLFASLSVECGDCGWINEDVEFNYGELKSGSTVIVSCDECDRRIAADVAASARNEGKSTLPIANVALAEEE
jgi:hypothetical protein